MTDIQKRRVIIYPQTIGPVYAGNSEDETVPYDAVPLTWGVLTGYGGSGLRQGETFAIQLALKYLDEDGAQTAVNLSSASSTVMQVWHASTAAWVTSRTEDAVIADSGALVELAIDGDGTAGTITIKWHQDESLTAGVHNFAILSDWTYSEPIAAGQIEVRNAIPTS